MDRVAYHSKHLILPFVVTSLVRFVKEILLMKAPMSKPNPSVLFFLLTDRRVRRIRDITLFCSCCPVYISAFCLSRGFFPLSEVFIGIFGLLSITGLFGEVGSLRLFAGVGVVLAVLQLLYVKIKERESLKYI